MMFYKATGLCVFIRTVFRRRPSRQHDHNSDSQRSANRGHHQQKAEAPAIRFRRRHADQRIRLPH